MRNGNWQTLEKDSEERKENNGIESQMHNNICDLKLKEMISYFAWTHINILPYNRVK